MILPALETGYKKEKTIIYSSAKERLKSNFTQKLESINKSKGKSFTRLTAFNPPASKKRQITAVSRLLLRFGAHKFSIFRWIRLFTVDITLEKIKHSSPHNQWRYNRLAFKRLPSLSCSITPLDVYTLTLSIKLKMQVVILP